MPATYTLHREILVEDGYDILVAGGGPAGCAAAICAARLGARVLLVEATGTLGGMATNGYVTAFDGMADGEKPLVGGFMQELVDTLHARGELPGYVQPEHWRKLLLCPTRFHPEPLKRLLDELAERAGVEVRLFTRLIEVDADPRARTVHGAILHQAEGLRYIAARAFVDATGDADLAALAGVEHRRAGRDTDHIMPASLCWLACNHRPQAGAGEAIHSAVEAGQFPYREFRAIISGLNGGQAGFNAGHLYDLDNLDTAHLSRGMAEGRRIAAAYNEFFRRQGCGYESMEITATAPLMGVRESRRIVGEYELTVDDFRARRHFPDQIGLFNKEVDIHVYTDDPEALRQHRQMRADRSNPDYWMGPGESYGLPYGMIVPRGWRNLWTPGRAASTDVIVHGSSRVMPAAAMMGQAAGTAAWQAIRTDRAAAEIDTAQLVQTLRENRAILPQQSLSPTLTRG